MCLLCYGSFIAQQYATREEMSISNIVYSVFTNGMMCHVTKATQKLSSHALLVCQQSVTSWFRRKRSDERGKKLQASWQRCGAAERCAGEFCMQQCVEARSGGRKRLRRVRGVHTNCCGATNGGCDGSGVALIETLSSAGCTRGRGTRAARGPGCAFCETGVGVVKGTASAV